MAYVGADYALSKRTGLYAEVDRNQLTDLYPTTTFMEPPALMRQSLAHICSGMPHRRVPRQNRCDNGALLISPETRLADCPGCS
jgi:hypothetical protein